MDLARDRERETFVLENLESYGKNLSWVDFNQNKREHACLYSE